MNTFLHAVFWVGLVSCFLRASLISSRTYPHQTTTTLKGDLMELMEGLVFVVWAAVLLWGGGAR